MSENGIMYRSNSEKGAKYECETKLASKIKKL